MSYFGVIFLLIIAATRFRLKSLLQLFFAASPFYSISIIAVAGFYFNAAFILSLIIVPVSIVSWRKFDRVASFNPTEIFWILFIFAAIFSIAVNLPKEGKFLVFNSGDAFYSFTYNLESLNFGLSNFYRISMISWFIAFSIVMARNIQSLKMTFDCIVSFLYGVVGAFVFSTFLALVYNFSGTDRVVVIMDFFSVDFSIESYIARIDQYKTLFGVSRLNTVVGEPSFASSLLLIALGLSHYTYTLTQERRFAIFRALILISFILINSTLGYLGLFLTAMLYSTWYITKRIVFSFAVTSALIACGILLIQSTSLIANTGSTIRIESIYFSLSLFIENPFFGLGFGSQRSTSFFLNTLVGMGTFGTLIFLLPFFLRARHIAVVSRNVSGKKRAALMFLLSCFSASWLTLNFGIPYVAFFFPWTWMTFYLPLGGTFDTNK